MVPYELFLLLLLQPGGPHREDLIWTWWGPNRHDLRPIMRYS